MSFPYLVIGAFPELARWILKPGAWMETFKQLMGFVLLFTVVFLFYTLGDEGLFVPTLTLIMGVWFACWLIGRVPLTASFDRKLQSWVYGVTFAAVIGMLAFRFLSPTGGHLQWQPFSPERLAAAQREGKTVMVDFTANWCLNCKVNQVLALETRRVAELVSEYGIVPMLADWTNRDSQEGQQVKDMLDSLGHSSIPLLAIYPAASPSEPVLLSDLLTESQVLSALRQAGPSRSMTATIPTSGTY
jgi:thiol:disulfide interchange protein